MWFACSIATNYRCEQPLNEPIQLGFGISLEPIPNWIKSDDALSQLSATDREHIYDAEIAFAATYKADALGSPDPEWKGKNNRSIQGSVDEKFALASVAFWLAKPSQLSGGVILHFGRKGDSSSLRQSGSLRPILISEDESENSITTCDIEVAKRLLAAFYDLDRDATTWSATRMLIRALGESFWEARFMFQWIALEALFGPSNPAETTFRLAQRIGLFIGNDNLERRSLFDQAKDAYSWRSRLVHGSKLSKLTPEKSLELSKYTETLLRSALIKLLTNSEHLAKFDGTERDRYLDELVFQ